MRFYIIILFEHIGANPDKFLSRAKAGQTYGPNL